MIGETVVHPIPLFAEGEPKVLILGSFPSVRSRESGFFYGHPQNRFWRVIAALTGDPAPKTVDYKKRLLAKNGIALWDVIGKCRITGSSDSSIRDDEPNDVAAFLKDHPVKAVFTNGNTAHRAYEKYILPLTGVKDIYLPSTSPANAAFGFEKLCDNWSVLKNYL